MKKGKLNILFGGQFGSEGKGAVASHISDKELFSVSAITCGANSGHTFYDKQGIKKVTKYFPVSALTGDKRKIYITANSALDKWEFMKEIEEFGLKAENIMIHPNCSIISEEDKTREVWGVRKIASTCSGTGQALIRKMNREGNIVANDKDLSKMVSPVSLNEFVSSGFTCFLETSQGMDLGLNSGFKYPYCTAKEIGVSQALADACVHPKYLGDVYVVIRVHPIRVGNITAGIRGEVCDSGPFWPDSKELTWSDIGVDPEYTTNTKRVRRVASFSKKQYDKMLKLFCPDFVYLNFLNYLEPYDIRKLLKLLPEVSHVGFGPKPSDFHEISNAIRGMV